MIACGFNDGIKKNPAQKELRGDITISAAKSLVLVPIPYNFEWICKKYDYYRYKK